MSLYTIVKQLQNASGSNAKQAILEANKDNELLKDYLKAVYDPAISYYITKMNKSIANEGYSFNGDIIDTLIHYLANRTVTGNAAKEWLEDYITMFNVEAQELIELLIKRSIGAGVGDTMILKVFPNLWFSVPYQRCSLMDEKIKAKFNRLPNFAIQKKLDGSFCYLVKEAGKPPEAITRAGSKYPKEFAEKLATGLPDGFVVVGELLVYGEVATLCVPLDRKTGNGILNSVLKGGEIGDNLGFELTAWDCLAVAEFKAGKSKRPYKERLGELDWFWNNIVETKYVKSLEEAYAIYSQYTANGDEGAVIKTTDFLWSNGTSKDCIKLKIECDLEVIAIHEGTGKASGMMGSITLKSSDGIIVTDCGSGFTDEDRKEWWWGRVNRIGSIVTVKANDIIEKRDSDVSSMFLPIFREHRLDKTEADSYDKCVQQLDAAKGVAVMNNRLEMIRYAWMRDFSYEDYLNACKQTRSISVSEYAYQKQCRFYEYEMQKSFEEIDQ